MDLSRNLGPQTGGAHLCCHPIDGLAYLSCGGFPSHLMFIARKVRRSTLGLEVADEQTQIRRSALSPGQCLAPRQTLPSADFQKLMMDIDQFMPGK